MKCIPNLSQAQIYPPAAGTLNANTCDDPDCGNFGVAAELATHNLLGSSSGHGVWGAGSNSQAVGLGRYKLAGTAGPEYRRISSTFEYTGDPQTWLDREPIECQFDGGRAPCGTRFELLSNDGMMPEIERLRGASGIFEGPRCRARGTAYLDAPREFIFDGAELSKSKREKTVPDGDRGDKEQDVAASAGADRIRLIHKPCKGKSGSRISATLDHRRQRHTADNVAMLVALVDGQGLSEIMRMMAPPGSGKTCGAKRVYDLIFWLEKTLLAFEKA